MNKIKVLDKKDNVATTLENLKSGEEVLYKVGSKTEKVTILNDISYGHKFAIRDIKKGSEIIKYGEVIGKATENINIGNHVHIHNVIGNRARKNCD